MIEIDFTNKNVLITGGTKGIGLSSALNFAKAGAQTYLTYKWGMDDFTPLYQKFEEIDAIKPILIQSDVSVSEDTDALLEKIKEKKDKIDIFISNVGFAQRTMNLDEYKKRSLFKTLEYSTWPLIEYTRKIKEKFGKYPSKILAISSDGPDHFYIGYDYVAASKALLEFFFKYLSVHLRKDGCTVNVIRFGPTNTESFNYIFGEDFFDYLRDNNIPVEVIMKPEECGKAVFGMCCDFFEPMNGQIVTVDRGFPFQDNVMMRYLESKNKNKDK